MVHMPIGYLITGIVTFVIFWCDKRAAVAGRRRVPEITLWVLSAAGGVWGGWAAMVFLRHKTRKMSFCFVMGVISAVHIILLTV